MSISSTQNNIRALESRTAGTYTYEFKNRQNQCIQLEVHFQTDRIKIKDLGYELLESSKYKMRDLERSRQTTLQKKGTESKILQTRHNRYLH